MSNFDFQNALHNLVDGRNLTGEQATDVMTLLMEGQASGAQIGALLVALRIKGETVEEVTAFARVMRAHVVPVTAQRTPLLDTCGTGGSRFRVFNVSTAAAFVLAASGVAVAKHGNRAMSGVCGSADVLEALGVRVSLTPEQNAQCIDRVGIGFLFAPGHHPSMRHVGAARREIGIRTVFNLLGPLTNPAHATLQTLGVYDRKLCVLAAETLRGLGSERALVMHGDIGLDEISTLGSTHVSELRGGTVEQYTLAPSDLGLHGPEPCVNDLAPRLTPEENAALLRDVLGGAGSTLAERARQDLVAVNAAASLRVCGRAETWPDAVALARDILDSGAALTVLDALRDLTQSFSTEHTHAS